MIKPKKLGIVYKSILQTFILWKYSLVLLIKIITLKIHGQPSISCTLIIWAFQVVCVVIFGD
jgi:hypothetical protein